MAYRSLMGVQYFPHGSPTYYFLTSHIFLVLNRGSPMTCPCLAQGFIAAFGLAVGCSSEYRGIPLRSHTMGHPSNAPEKRFTLPEQNSNTRTVLDEIPGKCTQMCL